MVPTAVFPSIGSRAAALLVALAFVGTTLAMLAPPAQAAVPDTATACGPIIEDGTGRYCVTQGGLLKTFSSRTGEFLGYIHGGDPVELDVDPFAGDGDEGGPETHGAPTLAGNGYPDDRAPHCVGPTSPHPEYYTQVVYVKYFNQPDTYAANVDLIRDLVRQANGLLHDTAKELGKPLLYKVKCIDGEIDVFNADLPKGCNQADCFNDIVTQLRGTYKFDDPKVKYWVWTEDTRCTCGGKGHVFPDDSLSMGNQNNGNAASSMFAVTFHGSNGVRVMMHEHGHNMGAVQDYSSGQNGANNQGHCWDGSDIMCYTEPGEAKPYSDNECPGSNHWDCKSDTYFHPKPPAGSYLETHWNLASHLNRYLVAGNAMPDPVADTYSIPEDSPEVSLAVLVNDKDEEGDPLYLHSIDDPPSGATVSIKDNRIAYEPPQDYYGIDVFSYNVRDRAETDNESVMFGIGTVTVDVRPINDAPLTMGNNITTPEDVPVSFTLDAVDAEGDPLTWKLSRPLRGEILGTPPDVTYEPQADMSGLDMFTFTATDPFGLASTSTIEISVEGRPDAPNARDDDLLAIDGVPQWPMQVLANDDAGPGDEPALETIKIVGYGPGGQSQFGGSLAVDDRETPETSDDVILYSPPMVWPPSFTGTDSFQYTIRDDGKLHGAPAAMEDTATVTVRVQPDHLAALPDFYAVGEDTVLEVTAPAGVLHNPSPAIPASTGKDPADHWPGKPAMTNVAATLVDAPMGGIELRPDGSFTYTPPADFSGEDTFTYYIETGDGDSNVATVTIDVQPVNDPPVPVDLQETLPEDAVRTIVLSAADVEDDAQTPPVPPTLAVASQPVHGRLVGSPPTVTYIPDGDYHGPDGFTYTATDGDGATRTASVTLVVEPVNDAPHAVPDDYLARPDQTNVFPLGRGPLRNDIEPDGDAMRIEVVQEARHGKVALRSEGGFSYTPPPGFLGRDHFVYRAVDPSGEPSLPATVQISVAHNVPPSAFFEFTEEAFATGAYIGVREGSRDIDGAIVSYLWEFGDGTTSTQRVPLHAYNAPGIYDVLLRVRDDDNAESTWSRSIQVSGDFARSQGGTLDMPPPVAIAGDDLSALSGDDVRLDGSLSHVEGGEVLAFAWTQRGGPAVELHNADGFDPYFTAPGFDAGLVRAVLTFQLVIFDGIQHSDPDTVQVVVFPRHFAPRLTVDAGPDQHTLSGAVVEAVATASATKAPAAYQWTQVSGPPVKMMQGGRSMQFEAPYVVQPTNFVFHVVALGDGLTSAPDVLNVTVVGATAPKGFATGGDGPERSFVAIVPEDNPALDPPLKFFWEFGDGAGGNGTAIKHAYTGPGAYKVRLTATNSAGYSESWEQEVVVPAAQPATLMEAGTPGTSALTWAAIAGAALLVIAGLGAASLWLARRTETEPVEEA